MGLLRRSGWTLLCVCAAVLLQSAFHQPVGFLVQGICVALVVVAALRPFDGLLLLASLGPLSTAIFLLATQSRVNLEFAEALTLAFIAGWAARQATAGTPLAASRGIRWACMLLLTAAVASGVANWSLIRAEHIAEPIGALSSTFFTREYLLHFADSIPITTASLLCQGALLLLITAHLCAGSQAKRDLVLSAMVLGASAAGALNLLRIVTAAMSQEAAWSAFLHYFRMLRVNVQYADLNAAGSYFALMLPIGMGLMARRRALAILCVPPIAAALWISGSRVAMAAVCLAIGSGALLALAGRSRRTAAAIALAVFLVIGVLAGLLWKVYPADRNAPANVALSVRVVLAKVGLDMAMRHPVFGVGLGRYYTESVPYLRESPIITGPENAHNNFIQILAELGLSGFVIFLATVLAPLHALVAGKKPLSATSVGLFAGLLAFLLSCMGGHPLLVPESSYPFWIAMGLAAASHPGAATGIPFAARPVRLVGGAVILAFIASLPYRVIESSRMADLSEVTIGLSRWQHEPDGTRFRWAGGRSTFFVASSARVVSIPLRNTGHTDLEVGVFLNGREVDRILLPADGHWLAKRLIGLRSDAKFLRIDLAVYLPGSSEPLQSGATDEGGAISVGRPTLQ